MTLRRNRALAGIALLEIAILVMVLAIAVTLTIPRLLRARVASNEARAALMLRNLVAYETAFRADAVVDQDADGVGEYGLLGELATRRDPATGKLVGELIPRAAQKRLKAAYLPEDFATGGRAPDADGCAATGGYVYRLCLAAKVGEDKSIVAGDDHVLGGTETQAGPTLTDVDAIDLQQKCFVVYAWPVEAGVSGKRAFAITQAGKLVATDMAARLYSGRGPLGAPNTPAADAAFTGEALVSPLADGKPGRDGNVWVLLKP